MARHARHVDSVRFLSDPFNLRVATVATVGSGNHVYCDIY